MSRCSFFCSGWEWLFLLVPLALLLPLLFFKWDAIESEVSDNTQTKLNSSGFEWAEVTTFNRGRDVLITGKAPNLEAMENARKIAMTAEGVRLVDIDATNIMPAPIEPPSVKTIITGNMAVVRGVVQSQTAIDQILSAAKEAFGSENVINKLSIGENIASAPDLSGIYRALTTDGKVGTITATLVGNSLSLAGQILGDEAKSKIDKALIDGGFSGELSNELSVAVPIEADVCQQLVNELLATGKINFQSGEAEIKENSMALLKNITTTAERCTEAQFEIAGHTDATGDADFNVALSKRRASAVVDYLVEQGLPADRFSAVGFGSSQPIASNSTAEGRAANRRIEFKLKN